MSESKIARGMVVEVRYEMHDQDGSLLDTTGDEPEAYVHGTGSIVPGLRRALEGKRAGDHVEVTLAPRDAFGTRRKGAGAQPVPRATFPEDATLTVGMGFMAESPAGEPVRLYISAMDDDVVYVDTQHPYAGKTIRYTVDVVSVRPATEAEQKNGLSA
ncbi:MAG: peptidylprolyl isomerase [Myxococcales bacterium]|nr:peptidylprolyl isomerase [Myxococcales bacterium]